MKYYSGMSRIWNVPLNGVPTEATVID